MNFKLYTAPGHTLDHVILCDHKNNVLFVGDVLFRLGCGRIFEGSHLSKCKLHYKKFYKLSDLMTVYCGHEYTLNNLKFLEYIFDKNNILEQVKKENYLRI